MKTPITKERLLELGFLPCMTEDDLRMSIDKDNMLAVNIYPDKIITHVGDEIETQEYKYIEDLIPFINTPDKNDI